MGCSPRIRLGHTNPRDIVAPKKRGPKKSPPQQRVQNPLSPVAPSESQLETTAVRPLTWREKSWEAVKVFCKNAIVLSWLAFFISLGSVFFAWQQVEVGREQAKIAKEQTELSKRTLEIATGKYGAKIEVADYFPTSSDFPAEDVGTLFGPGGLTRAYFRNANSMVMRAPALYFNNVGEAPIDRIRVEVSFVSGLADRVFQKDELKNPPADWYKNDTPVLLRSVHREEYELSRPWNPGEGLRIVILKGVLDQISQVQSRTAKDKLHHAELAVEVSARLAGSPIFSGSSDMPIHFFVTWLPTGFTDDECKRVLDGYIPVHLFVEKRQPRIHTAVMQNPHRGFYNDLPNLGSYGKPEGGK